MSTPDSFEILFIAYTLIWFVIFFFIMSLSKRTRLLEKKIMMLDDELKSDSLSSMGQSNE